MSQVTEGGIRYERLKRTAPIGYGVLFAWYGVAGGYLIIVSGNLFGWVALVLGIGVLALPFIPAVRVYVEILAANRAFPALVFIPNLLIIILYVYLASIYIGDPFLTYNDMDTFAAVVFGGAALLAAATLVVNLIAYLMDRRT
jgi:hypothetical protein